MVAKRKQLLIQVKEETTLKMQLKMKIPHNVKKKVIPHYVKKKVMKRNKDQLSLLNQYQLLNLQHK